MILREGTTRLTVEGRAMGEARDGRIWGVMIAIQQIDANDSLDLETTGHGLDRRTAPT